MDEISLLYRLWISKSFVDIDKSALTVNEDYSIACIIVALNKVGIIVETKQVFMQFY